MPHVALAELPTPVEELHDLAVETGHSSLWVKRDDLTSPTYGGNKVRKLEFLLGEARQRGCKTVLTMGGTGTNHGLATAVFAKELGLACQLALFPQPVTEHVRKSLKLYHAHGATMHFHRTFGGAAFRLLNQELHNRSRVSSRQTAVLGPGGSSPLGTLGFVNAALELAAQIKAGELPEPETIFCALGSKGTHAGLHLGMQLAGLKSRVVGVRVTPSIGANRYAVAALANKSRKLLRSHGVSLPIARIKATDVTVDNRFFGGGYGKETSAGSEALKTAACNDITLEPTYTAKTFAAFLAVARSNTDKGPLLFWNTFSSVDLSALAETVPISDLPRPFQRCF